MLKNKRLSLEKIGAIVYYIFDEIIALIYVQIYAKNIINEPKTIW